MKTLILILIMIVSQDLKAQSKLIVEQYNYLQQPASAMMVPIINFETKKGWCAELRYNYEDVQTISLYAGKSFSGGKTIQYTLAPMLGLSAGVFTGLSFAINADMEWKNFYLSLESQYSKDLQKKAESFFFNWSELGYTVSDHVFAGLAFQYTLEQYDNSFEPGVFAGLSFKNVSIPFYAFNPFNPERYFVLGVNIEYNFRQPKNKNPL